MGPRAIALLVAALFALAPASAAALPDGRGWELVSPPEKNGGGVSVPAEAPGATRVAQSGEAVAFTSKASFANGQGASPQSQYIARRTAEGWVTENITPAHLSGAYQGSPYLAFSADLGKALLANPARCPAGDPCPQGFALRDNATGQILATLEDPGELESASADLAQIVLRKGADLHLWAPPAPGLTPVSEDPTAPAVSFFLDAAHLYRRAGGVTIDLTPAGGVDTLLAAEGGATAYYRSGQSIWRWREGAGLTQIVTAFGSAALADTSAPSSGVSTDGERLFFTTATKLAAADVNFAPDAYQWQAQGKGSCAKAPGCVELISAGLAGTSTFIGASASGDSAFFLTDRSLLAADTGARDLYVARVGGGFPEPSESPLCLGDACQTVPPAPEDPVLTTVLAGPGNPAERYLTYPSAKKKRCAKGKRAVAVKTKRGKRIVRCVAVKQKGKRGGGGRR